MLEGNCGDEGATVIEEYISQWTVLQLPLGAV